MRISDWSSDVCSSDLRPEREVAPGDTELVVVVEVVRRRDQRDDAGEALLADPDDLLLAPHPPVVRAVAARPLAHGELVLQDPREVAGLDPLGPLALHGHHWHSLSSDGALMRPPAS